jgi:hypothetical protein
MRDIGNLSRFTSGCNSQLVSCGRARLSDWTVARLVPSCVAAFIFVLAGVCSAQTNLWYHPAQLDFEAGPSVFFPMSNAGKPQYGYFLDTTYWQTFYTGTSLEVGNYDFTSGLSSVMGYTAALEKFRIIPFSSYRFWGRLELEADTGAVTWTDDGSKGVSVGFEAQFALGQYDSIYVRLDQQFDTETVKNGGSIKAALTLWF